MAEDGPAGSAGRDFVQSLSRGLDVLLAFADARRPLTLAEVAQAAGLARPTARRLLLTLTALGYVRTDDGLHALTPRVLDLGMAFVSSRSPWEIARPHMEALVARTGESSSIAQLDGSDIVYVGRVAVPKIIALSVSIGTRFPALPTSMGQVLLAALPADRVAAVLAEPSRSGVTPRWQPGDAERDEVLAAVRARGHAVADEVLATGIRSVAVPLRGGDGGVVAALNVTTHAAETSLAVLLEEHLPRLRATASDIGEDLARLDRVPLAAAASTVDSGPSR